MKIAIMIIAMLMLFAPDLTSQERYVIKCPPDKAQVLEKRTKILNSIVGIGENEYNNRGTLIDEMLKSSGLNQPKNPKSEGYPWCQAKSTWTWIKAGYLPYPKTALANAPYNYAKQYGKKTLCKPHVGDEQKWKDRYSSSGHNEDVAAVFKNGNTLNNAGNIGPHSKTNDAKRSKVCLIQRTPGKPLGKMPHRGYVGFDFT